MEIKIKIKKWLAEEKCLPTVVEGSILRETAKAVLLQVADCHLTCKTFIKHSDIHQAFGYFNKEISKLGFERGTATRDLEDPCLFYAEDKEIEEISLLG